MRREKGGFNPTHLDDQGIAFEAPDCLNTQYAIFIGGPNSTDSNKKPIKKEAPKAKAKPKAQLLHKPVPAVCSCRCCRR